MSLRVSLACAVLWLVLAPTPCLAQGDSITVLRGVVRASTGAPIEGANVFVLETLDGVLTGADGTFAIRARASANLTLIVRRPGFIEHRRLVAPGQRDVLSVTLAGNAQPLATVTVRAGEYTTGEERGAMLTPLEVVMTPGTAADVNRAIQTLPGVQGVDEGTALFVRGGDYTETRVVLDGASLFVPVQLIAPSGTFIGSVDPFLLDGITFSSGGFGARHGNALSAVADLRTLARPTHSEATLGAGLAAISFAGGLAPTPTTGLRVAGNINNLEPVIRVNGASQDFDPPPHGRDLSANLYWTHRPGGEVRLFALRQTNALAIGLDEADHGGSYGIDIGSTHAVLSWRDIFGRVGTSFVAASSRFTRSEDFGAFRLRSGLRSEQIAATAELDAIARVAVRGGVEAERVTSEFDGSIPTQGPAASPGARTRLLGSADIATRTALYAETDLRIARLRFVTGIRADRSTVTQRTTIDPRVSIAIALAGSGTVTAAWGIYHQIPDPLYFDDTLGMPGLRAMRAAHTVLGVQIGEGATLARAELYEKRYANLTQLTRDYIVVTSGVGSARGLDVFVKGNLPLGFTHRLTISAVAARRTDPETGVVTRAPHDVTYTTTAVVDRRFAAAWAVGAAYRYATGRPLTPIVGATRDPDRDLWVPTYGEPMSERHPRFERVDLSLSHLRMLSSRVHGVFYVALGNVLDRVNVQRYRYSRDYEERFAVRSIFNRTVYFGASVTAR
jgi:hypothetical protein